jgi:hypothetical protein
MRTRHEVEQAAHMLGENRHAVWLNCGIHNWQALPTTDTGDHYCENCCTLWSSAGAVLNPPERPRFNFTCAVQLPDGTPAEIHQTDAQRDERQGVVFFLSVEPRDGAQFRGRLRLSSPALTSLDECPGDTRAHKSRFVKDALVEWVHAHGLQPNFALEVHIESDGQNCRVSFVPHALTAEAKERIFREALARWRLEPERAGAATLTVLRDAFGAMNARLADATDEDRRTFVAAVERAMTEHPNLPPDQRDAARDALHSAFDAIVRQSPVQAVNATFLTRVRFD